MSIKSVLERELELISLSREEVMKLDGVAKNFIALLKGEGLKAYVGGSLAKGTLVKKDKQDVDVFVVFDYSEDILKLEGILKGIKLSGKLKKVHGSRDYFQIDCGDVVLEVVPVVKNKDPELAENVTDVSLSHVKYVVGALKKSPGLADEIKLAKTFCYANRCYGAESYVKGFSGYALEVLVIYFGGFLKFLKKLQKFHGVSGCRGVGVLDVKKIVVDPLKYFKGERDVLNEINASKLTGPVVVVDPTYKYRNVTAGLGLETFVKFNEVAKKFLKSPSLSFFERKDVDVKALKALCTSGCRSSGCRGVGKRRFVEVDLSTDRQEGDIAGTKMKKLLDFFAKELVRRGQKVLAKEFDYDGVGKEAKGYLVVGEKLEVEVRGPSVGLQDAIKNFKRAKGKSVFARKGFWWFRDKVSVESVFESVKKVMSEMGANGVIVQ